LISKLTGNKELDQTDIEATIAQFKEGLMAKNVAVEIADKLCDSVSEGLIGTKKGAFTTMRAKIREALEASVVKILTPKRSIDVLRDIEVANNSERRPCDPSCPTHRTIGALPVWVGGGLGPAAPRLAVDYSLTGVQWRYQCVATTLLSVEARLAAQVCHRVHWRERRRQVNKSG
jgi:hypothetical protein